jgi:hypothetical protein
MRCVSLQSTWVGSMVRVCTAAAPEARLPFSRLHDWLFTGGVDLAYVSARLVLCCPWKSVPKSQAPITASLPACMCVCFPHTQYFTECISGPQTTQDAARSPCL